MTVMDSRVPSTQQGCFNGAGAFGHNTYYWDQATLQGYFGAGFPARRFTQEQYDEKSMNCAPYWMYAAFCAWDGGRMPTQAEMNDAWGTGTYPYSTGVNNYPFPLSPTGAYAWETNANYLNNNNTLGGNFYGYPAGPNGADEAGMIAAPGRFILDKTLKTSVPSGESWMDLGANMMEMVHVAGAGTGLFCDWSVFVAGVDVPSPSCVDDTTHPGNNGVLRSSTMGDPGWTGGSWEGHRAFSNNLAAQPFFTNNSYFTIPAQTQYGKAGVRCVR
jgi:hypothetical protein